MSKKIGSRDKCGLTVSIFFLYRCPIRKLLWNRTNEYRAGFDYVSTTDGLWGEVTMGLRINSVFVHQM